MNEQQKISYPDKLKELSCIFNANGYSLYIVGGYVRDFLLGYISSDIDICSEASAEKVLQMLSDREDIKIEDCNMPMGTLLIKCAGIVYEYTAFRSDSYARDGSHKPRKVSFNVTIKQDAKRRDFACNAIYYDLANNEFTDFFGGMKDIAEKKLKTTVAPCDVFAEDALRILRMCRICAEYKFSPDERTLMAAMKLSGQITKLSKERVICEMHRLIISDERRSDSDRDNLKTGLRLLFECRASDVVLPGVKFADAYLACDAKSIAVKIALLARVSENRALSLDYLCANGELKKQAVFLINNEIFDDSQSLDYVADFGYEKCVLLSEFLSILKVNADNLNKYLSNMKINSGFLSESLLAVSGEDIMERLEISSSPKVGKIKKELLKYIIQFPVKNKKDLLLDYAETICEGEN